MIGTIVTATIIMAEITIIIVIGGVVVIAVGTVTIINIVVVQSVDGLVCGIAIVAQQLLIGSVIFLLKFHHCGWTIIIFYGYWMQLKCATIQNVVCMDFIQFQCWFRALQIDCRIFV